MAHAAFGFYPAEREVQAIVAQLRQAGLSYPKVSDRLTALGYSNRQGRPYGGMGVARITYKIAAQRKSAGETEGETQ